ncbi:MAG: SPOR domain-containing protein [Candidatus Kapaibacteriota bacterium]
MIMTIGTLRRTLVVSLPGIVLAVCSSLPLRAQDVSTGPSPLPANLSSSYYLRGVSNDTLAAVSRVHVAGYRRTPAGLSFQVVLTDERGNARSPKQAGGSWVIRSGCRGETMAALHAPIVTENNWQFDTPPTAAYVLVDHSLMSSNLAPAVLEALSDRAAGFAGMDSIGIAIFDHELFEVSPIDAPYRAGPRCAGLPQQPPAGIPAVYRALRHAISVVGSRGRSYVVLVTASNDMASLGASVRTLVEQARSSDVAVVVIAVGPDVRGYEYRFLTAATGGRLYRLEATDAASAVDVLREVLYSAKQHLDVFIPRDTVACTDELFVIGWQPDTSDVVLADTIMVPDIVPDLATNRAVVALFPDTTNQGVEDYAAILQMVAEELMADTSRVLQLVGHVSPDVRSNHDDVAEDRVAVVVDALREAGVLRQQLRVRSDGSRRPLFYLQTDGTQRLLNNRVEAYYLRDADLPYTVLVGQYDAEELALQWVETWSGRGYRAYMEPILDGRKPAYQVRLWGFSTRQAAETVAQLATKKYKATAVSVE